MLAQHHRRLRNAHAFWRHDLIGIAVGHHPVLVHAGFMRKRVGPYDGLVGRNGHARDGGEQLAGLVDLFCVDVAVHPVKIAAGLYAHHNLL